MKNEISVNIDITVVVHVSVLIIKKGDHVESSEKGFEWRLTPRLMICEEGAACSVGAHFGVGLEGLRIRRWTPA